MSEKAIQIVGIILVKNEDRYLETVIRNVIDFCDKLIVLDNNSRDQTWPIIERLAGEFSKIEARRLNDSLTSHRFIEQYAGSRTWIFGVDGDEIYDPAGLADLRERIGNGEFQNFWRLWGHALHCVKFSRKKGAASGYLAPPAKPVTKLYNFYCLDSWQESRAERLHGKNLKFKPEFGEESRQDYKFSDKLDWGNSPLRCLHLSFVRRSSQEQPQAAGKGRLGPTQDATWIARMVNFWRNLLYHRKIGGSYYKVSRYQQGLLVDKKIQEFIGN